MHSVRRNDAAFSYKTQQPHQHLRIVHPKWRRSILFHVTPIAAQLQSDVSMTR